MLRGNRELWLAFLAMLLITGMYGLVLVATREIPPAGELFGHGIGIVGFIVPWGLVELIARFGIRLKCRKAGEPLRRASSSKSV